MHAHFLLQLDVNQAYMRVFEFEKHISNMTTACLVLAMYKLCNWHASHLVQLWNLW
jgi:hypothetical protein